MVEAQDYVRERIREEENYSTIQATVDALTEAREISPALMEIVYSIIAGQGGQFVDAAIVSVTNSDSLLLELEDGTRWVVGVRQMSHAVSDRHTWIDSDEEK